MTHESQKRATAPIQRAAAEAESVRGTGPGGQAGGPQAAWQGYVRGLGAGQGAGQAASQVAGHAPGQGGQGAGRALPEAVKGRMEQSFGTDLSAVRVHEGEAAPALGARAFAQGDEVHFAPGQYDPQGQGGQELLGHELAHVVQQRQGRVSGVQGRVSGVQGKGNIVSDAALETEADRAGEKAARGESAGLGPVGNARSGAVQRHKELQSVGAVTLDLAGGDPARAAELVSPLKTFGVERLSRLRAEWPECFAAPIGSDRVEMVLHFVDAGQTLEDARFVVDSAPEPGAVFPLMRLFLAHVGHSADVRTEITTAAGDATAAGEALTTLSKYNFDRTLMAWTQKQAENKAQPDHDKAVKEADERRDAVHTLNPDPKPSKSQQKAKRNKHQPVSKKRQAELEGPKKVRDAADLAHTTELQSADTVRDERISKTKVETEAFLVEATSKVGAVQAEWIIRKSGADAKLAHGLLMLMASPEVQPEAIVTAEWAFSLAGGQLKGLTDATRDLNLGLSAGATLPRSREMVELARAAKVPGPQVGWLATEAAKSEPEWNETRQLVAAHPGKVESAKVLLEGARAAQLPVSEVQKLGNGANLDEVSWAMKTAKFDKVEASQLLGLLGQNNPTVSNMDPLFTTHGLTVAEAVEFLALVEKGQNQSNPVLLAQLLGKASVVELRKLLKHYPAYRCKEALITDNIPTAGLVTLVETVKTEDVIGKLLMHTKRVNGLNTALAGGITGAALLALLDTWLGTARVHFSDDDQRVPRMVKCVKTPGFGAGTFTTAAESLMYHYQKHVVLPGLAQTVATYVADAIATGQDASYSRAENGPNAWKLTKYGSTRGGIYNKVGLVPLSFWYTP